MFSFLFHVSDFLGFANYAYPFVPLIVKHIIFGLFLVEIIADQLVTTSFRICLRRKLFEKFASFCLFTEIENTTDRFGGKRMKQTYWFNLPCVALLLKLPCKC
ncbi:hypothetical protein I3842_Q059600 [Carya illinoinensis]|uniref:Uncharacterized protein n=1 Tax=Carya illinoinensis TaxID=32201 RepID=A0A922A271_CARIL|nr:hypothetical protein I3842_Q059600 [Carya illinoinensis]